MTTTTAFVLFGQLRTFMDPRIAESYRRCLINQPLIDLYVICWDKRGFSMCHGQVNRSEFERREELCTTEEIETHFKQFPFFNLAKIIILNFEEVLRSWTQAQRDIYYTGFNYNTVTTSIVAQYLIQCGSQMIDENKNYRQIYFVRPDSMIKKLFSSHDLTLEDNVLYFHHWHAECIDHGFFMNSVTVKSLYDIFDRYIDNMKNVAGTNPYFCQSQDDRDNNNLIKFHVKSKCIRVHNESETLFEIIR